MKNERDRCIAFAGIFQAAELTAQVAHRGIADTQAMEASIYSLFQLNSPSVEAVYNGLAGVTSGLKIVSRMLHGSGSRNLETTKYVVSLLHLEKKLRSNRKMQQHIALGINTSLERLAHYPMLHPNILAGTAEIYSDTISRIKPQIMVQGDPLHLKNPENVNKIRSLLLAGIRSAMLWHQCGGSKLRILLSRKRVLQMTATLLQEISQLSGHS
ncbi:MAG: high frequency lysogenization protein HflD [Gammaproteobacteria bacterium]|nr:high frequency lysogenization protein HflD [Gammaproteobacteria bacterium]